MAHTLHCSVAQLLEEKAPTRSAEIERVEAMIEPLDLDERALVVNLLESAVAFVRQRKVGRPRKRPAKEAGSAPGKDADNAADGSTPALSSDYVDEDVDRAGLATDASGKCPPTN